MSRLLRYFGCCSLRSTRPPKAIAATARVDDREEQPIAKEVEVPTIVGDRGQASRELLLLAEAGFPQVLAEPAADRCVTQREGLDRLLVHAALDQVAPRRGAGRAEQQPVIVGLRRRHQLVEAGSRLVFGDVAGGAELDAGHLGQRAQRLAKLEVLALHQPVEGAALLPAAKAHEGVAGREDIERRRLLLMERAQPFVAGARPTQLHGPTDQLDQVDAGLDLVRDAAHALIATVWCRLLGHKT